MSKSSIKNKIKENKLKEIEVYIPQWQENVTIKELSGKEFVEISTKCIANNDIDQSKFFLYAVLNSVYSENEQLFDNTNEIETLSSEIYLLLVEKISTLNNIQATNNPKN